MTTVAGAQIVPSQPASVPELRAADQGVASSLESVLSNNTRRTYDAQWRLFRRLVRPGGSHTPARRAPHRGPLPGCPRQRRRLHRHPAPGHLGYRQGPPVGEAGVALPGPGGARLSPRMGKAPLETPAPVRGAHRRRPGRDPAHRSPAAPARPRLRDGGAGSGKGEVRRGLVAVLSDAGLRRSEAAALTWGDVQRWDDGSGRITVIRSKTDAEAQGAVVAITPAAMAALSAIRPAGVGGEVKVFGLSESQIARRVKAVARAAGLSDWEFFSGHSGRVGMARRMAQNGAPTHEIERQGRWKQGGGMVGRYTRGESAGSALPYL